MSNYDDFVALRPNPAPLKPASAHDVWDRLAQLHPELAEPDGQQRVDADPDVIGPFEATKPKRDRQRRWSALVGAAAAVVAGVSALGFVASRADPSSDLASSAPGTAIVEEPALEPAATESEIADSSTANAQAPGVDASLVDAEGFLLPTAIPPGYVLSQLRAGRPSDLFESEQWVRPAAAGRVEATFDIRQPKPAEAGDEEESSDGETTGRGVRIGIFDRGDSQWAASWIEDGMALSARGSSLTREEFIDAIDALTIDAELLEVELSDSGAALGFVAVDDLGYAPRNSVESGVTLDLVDAPAQGTLSASATPNMLGRSLDEIADPADGWTSLTDGDQEYRRLNATLEGNPLDQIAFQIEGFNVMVSSNDVGVDALDFAQNLRLVSATDFVEAIDQRNERLLGWPLLGEATIETDTTVSVRSRLDGTGADVICLEGPVIECRLQISEASLVDGFADNVFTVLDTGEARYVVGWQSSTEAERLGQPSLADGEAHALPAGFTATTTAVVDQIVATEAGRIIVIAIPNQELPPHVQFRNNGELLMSIPPQAPTVRLYTNDD